MKSTSKATSSSGPDVSVPEASTATAKGGRGNAFAQEQLGGGGGDGHGHDDGRSTKDMPSAQATGPLAAPTKADVTAAEGFVAGGKKGPVAITPKTGIGGFDASYDPAGGPGQLDVVVRGGVNFIDPVKDDGSGKAVATDPAYEKIAKALNRLKSAERRDILPQFAWSSDAADRQDWLDRLKESVESKWDRQHAFHVHRPGWTWVGAEVEVDVQVAARTARKADDHVSVDAVKMPDAQNLYAYDLSSSVTSNDTANPHDQTMRLASTDIDERSHGDIMDIMNVYFASGSAVLPSGEQDRVRKWARTFQGDPTHKASHAIKALVEAHTDSVGGKEMNQALSERRLAHVLGLLKANGFTDVDTRLEQKARGEEQMRDDDKDFAANRRVMIKIDNPGGTQVLAAHEFGHMFGLGDQYATKDKEGRDTSVKGTGGQTGEAAAHDGLARNMLDENGDPLGGSIYENNDGMMSGGNKVYAEQYSTFHDALKTVSGVSEWALGGPQKKPDPTTQTP